MQVKFPKLTLEVIERPYEAMSPHPEEYALAVRPDTGDLVVLYDAGGGSWMVSVENPEPGLSGALGDDFGIAL